MNETELYLITIIEVVFRFLSVGLSHSTRRTGTYISMIDFSFFFGKNKLIIAYIAT